MLTRSRKAFRAFLATSITAVLTATLVSAVPTTASAATPTEIATFPADSPGVTAPDTVVFAGATGLLHHRVGGAALTWTDYGTGTSRPAPALDGVAPATIHPGGGDHIAVYGTATGGTVAVGVPGSASLTSRAVPDGYQVVAVGADGTRAVVFAAGGSAPPSMKLLDLSTGALSDIGGVPSTVVFDSAVRADGADHVLLSYRTDRTATTVQHLLLDLTADTGSPVSGLPASSTVTMTPEVIAWPVATADGQPAVAVLRQSTVLAGGSQDPVVVPIPANPSYEWLPDGDHLVAAPAAAANTPPAGPVLDIPFDGTASHTLLPARVSMLVQAADGSVVVAGGASAASAAVHRFVPADSGALADETVLAPAAVQSSNAGLVMAHGNLRHVESYPTVTGQVRMRLYNHGVAPDADPTGAPYGPVDGGLLPLTTQPCATDQTCVRGVDGAAGGITVIDAGTQGNSSVFNLYDAAVTGTSYFLGKADARVVDASRDWVVVDSASTGNQYVLDPAANALVSTAPSTGAALWQNLLYRATASNVVTEYELSPTAEPRLVRRIQVGAPCQPDEVQVTQHWLYWSCAGVAGIRDLTGNVAFAVPPGPAELGDGFLVQQDSLGLQLIDVHTEAAAQPVRLASLPAGALSDDRNVGWTVDRYSGDVAYVSADDSVHVLATEVPASPPTGSAVSRDFTSPRESYPWTSQATFDRPVSGWKVTLTRKATGEVLFTEAGGATRQLASASWDGKLPDGSYAPNGDYRFQWYGTVDGTSMPFTGASGTMQVLCGARVFRDYYCAGSGGLMRDDTTNYDAGLELGASDGGLHAGPSTSYWPLGAGGYSMLIPFGDLNGDGHDDLLVRNNSGEVGGYLGDGGGYFERGVSEHVTIGSGYGGFTAIVSTGDLNGDGIDDLVVRNSAGVLYFKAGTGKSQFKPGVRFTAGWNKYVKLIGAGDLDGDGCGDLLAVDGDGVMWFYRGTKDGKFATKVRIGAGWAKYNAVIGVGDITGDGIPDLIARDSAGTIWRYDGTGHATWSTKAQIATGWSKYALF
ncbi:FG-GAP-like repeat-containing protein [Actinocatenispora comari]|uniref:VCBS repeat-containing protein n=1 Tax=Actinocatenispora comari TaxID=2807577 RepID=A0A8J4AEJ4_9ACTN|nr:FG-GAP-like repeat-containing protein [Actinocatenispora comari]GIL29608.1 hypothetical protein NUM_48620 [Actinocatenispora comari]